MNDRWYKVFTQEGRKSVQLNLSRAVSRCQLVSLAVCVVRVRHPLCVSVSRPQQGVSPATNSSTSDVSRVPREDFVMWLQQITVEKMCNKQNIN